MIVYRTGTRPTWTTVNAQAADGGRSGVAGCADDEWIGAAEAAERLGVKPASLYSYVSRGVLARRREPGGRGSLFNAAEVDGWPAGAARAAPQVAPSWSSSPA